MSDTLPSIAQHYHERTKYDPDTIAAKSRPLDWNQQPVPYKTYKLGTAIDLKTYLTETPPEGDRDWLKRRRLSLLLRLSYGVTAKLEPPGGEPIYLRSSPSAGGLYPAELYVLARGMSFLPPGLYNYQSRTHTLVHYWEDAIWQGLQEACFWHPTLANTHIALVTTAVFFRSAWRYQDRAYRRIYLDTGHLLGNLELAGSLCNFRPHLFGGFDDAAMDELLYLDRDREGVTSVMALADQLEIEQNLSPQQLTALPSGTTTYFPKLPDGDLLPYLHQHTAIDTEPDGETLRRRPELVTEDKYNFTFCLKIATTDDTVDWVSADGLRDTMLRRRSTRAYTGEDLTLEELSALLSFTYHPDDYRQFDLDPEPDYFDLNLISTFVAVSGATGLEAGCYYYAPKARELRQIRFKNFRSELHYLCLGQELGRDAAAVVFHTADLQQGIARYGDRVYRYLHADAGHLGQRLNLAAIRMGLGVSGIAGFFDDRVNEVLGIPEDEAALYLTTLGRPRRRPS